MNGDLQAVTEEMRYATNSQVATREQLDAWATRLVALTAPCASEVAE